MYEFPYLIAIALIEEEGKRAMPLGGRSLKKNLSQAQDPDEIAETIALELLLRLIQRTDRSSFCRAAGDQSFLLVEIPMEAMQNDLPPLKANWLETGDSDQFFSKLKALSLRIWSLSFVKYQGVSFARL